MSKQTKSNTSIAKTAMHGTHSTACTATRLHRQSADHVDQGRADSSGRGNVLQNGGVAWDEHEVGQQGDRTGNESFFSSLKEERMRKRVSKTRNLARADVFSYIGNFYSRACRRSHLGSISPEAFQQAPA